MLEDQGHDLWTQIGERSAADAEVLGGVAAGERGGQTVSNQLLRERGATT